MQGVTAIGLIVALCLVVLFTNLCIPDLIASFLTFIPTGWLILSVPNLDFGIKVIGAELVRDTDGLAKSSRNVHLSPQEREKLAITWRKVVKSLGLSDSVKEFARMYDAGMEVQKDRLRQMGICKRRLPLGEEGSA